MESALLPLENVGGKWEHQGRRCLVTKGDSRQKRGQMELMSREALGGTEGTLALSSETREITSGL